MRVTFRSGELGIEGALMPVEGATHGAVVCHPHPQYGGDMNNNVVMAICSALHDSGYATLRFNFRGVGASDGSYSNGIGEAEDACAAVAYLIERAGVESVTLAGYSFGAMVVLQAGSRLTAVDRLIGVAPPLSFFKLDGLSACSKEKLFIVGDSDQYCSVAQLTRQLTSVAEPKMHHIVRGADHFFLGHESEVSETVRAFCRRRPS